MQQSWAYLFVGMLLGWALSRTPPSAATREAFADRDAELRYLRNMTEYLQLAVQVYAAQHDLYRMSQGHGMAFNSPRLDGLRRKMEYLLDRIKSDPEQVKYFQQKLQVLV